MTIDFSFSKIIDKVRNYFLYNSQSKIKLANNKPLSKREYQLVSKLCDVFIAIGEATQQDMISPPEGGIFWSNANNRLGPFGLHLRKSKSEIEHSFLMNTRFRDFATIAYEFDKYTPKPDFWVERYKDLIVPVQKRWRIRIPARFGEIGWNVDGYPVNRLTGINQERIAALHISGITHYLEKVSAPKILEIGAGGGEMGYALCKALPNCTWFDCDLLNSLVYSAIHLAIFLPKKRHYIYVGNLKLSNKIDESLIIRSPKEAAEKQNAIINIPNFLLDDFIGHLNLHFAYNTYSFGEMPKKAVMHYIELLAGFLKEQGVLFEQNGYFPDRDGDNPEDVLATQFKQLPLLSRVDGRWFHSGPIRMWFNNKMDITLQNCLNEATASKNGYPQLSIDNMLNVLMKTYPLENLQPPQEAWGELGRLFPQGI